MGELLDEIHLRASLWEVVFIVHWCRRVQATVICIVPLAGGSELKNKPAKDEAPELEPAVHFSMAFDFRSLS